MEFVGGGLNQNDLCLSDDWDTIQNWIYESKDVPVVASAIEVPIELKNPKISKLFNYSNSPNRGFWDVFPKNNPWKICKIVNR